MNVKEPRQEPRKIHFEVVISVHILSEVRGSLQITAELLIEAIAVLVHGIVTLRSSSDTK